MPDGDKIHKKLSRCYQKPYRELCEGKANMQECAWATMAALLKNIKRNGDIPIQIAQLMGSYINEAIVNAGNRQKVDWQSISQNFDRLAQQFKSSHYLKEIVLRAGKKILHDLRYGRQINSSNLSVAILTQYIHELYRLQFRDRIPLTPQHHAGIDNTTLEQSITDMETGIFPVFSKWANKANTEGSVTKLRRPSRQNVQPIDMEENLL